MCLIVFAWQTHPKYPLIVLANRDEFYHRPTQPIHWWEDYPNVLAGKDVANSSDICGTWMGITKSGRFSAITNIRAPQEKNPNLRTRGELVTSYLISATPIDQHVQHYSKYINKYNGFNLINADLNANCPQMYWLSNRIFMGQVVKPKKIIRPVRLTPGIYGLSNAQLDTPWPKLKKSISDFAQIVAMDDGRFSDGSNYLNIMQNQEKADDNDLPSTGVSYQWEKLLSSIFITSESYGTRSTTLIRVNQSGDFQVHEQTHLPNLPISNVEFSGRLTIESSHLP